MKKLALALLAAFPLFGADEALPSVESVYNHLLAATGGRAAYEARHSLIEHATIDFAKQGLKGSLTIYEAAPNKYLGLTELPGIGKIATGSNGEIAWENTVLQGPRIKQGVEKTDALRDGAFNPFLSWQKLYAKAETVGSETVEGHDCYKIVLTPSEGKPMTEFYDKKSGLMVKSMATVSSQMGDVNAEILYDDYRKDSDNILSPHRRVERAAQQEVVIQIDSVEVNPDLPKDRFDLPPEIQALLNKSVPAETKPAPAPANKGAVQSPDSGKLTIYMAGNPVANETYSLKKSANGFEIDGSGSANLGPMKIDIERFEVLMDAKYQPLEAIAKAKLGQIQMNVNTTFADGQAKNEIDTGQGPQTKLLPVHANAIVVNSNLPLYPWTVLARRASLDTRQPQQFPVYVLGQAEVNATVVFEAREHVDFAGKSAELNHLTVNGSSPQGQPISIDFWVDDNRQLIKIAVPSQSVEAYQDGFEPRVETKGATSLKRE
ncbi:MAG TPA: DUF620 domain-containing protein [Bryobacteraceae bacterium]|nr:DUF620 domain-containing protein [Bryobacteraceae bacterium]